jgi:acetoin utilization protein AcuB
MNVVDIMTHNPITVMGDQPIVKALALMASHGCKHLPVLSRSHHLVGVISDRDIRYALESPFTQENDWAQHQTAHHIKISTVMTAAPIIVEPQAPAEHAAELMLSHSIGCLPVMRAETLVGIITRSDILIAFINIQQRASARNNGAR